jgi:Protein of unknown function (DUF4038)/Putative collagen-binding domain of a collagenase
MAPTPFRQGSPRRLLRWAIVALALVAVVGSAVWVYERHVYDGQRIAITAQRPSDVSAPWPAPAPTVSSKPSGPPFATSVSPKGRFFLDQYGKPFLVKGDSPWAMMTRVSPEQADLWFTDREKQGFNAAIVSLVGAVANGGPNDDGSTYDGLRPFVDGDILSWNEPYWQRVTSYLTMAAHHGITVMLYPIDGWTIGHSFVPSSIEQCQAYGTKVAERFQALPNIVWMSGGDYFPPTELLARGSDVDHCIDAMMRGIRARDDRRPFSIQLGYDKSVSTENPYWARRVDWNFVYTYYPTYRAVLEAYQHPSRMPAVLGEANYEGENNQTDTPPTTDATLRRQVLWALTSGAAGEFMGSDDWEFHDGWQERLSTPAVTQIRRLRTLFSEMPWWQLVPDPDGNLVTGGRGVQIVDDRPMDVLENDYVTAAATPDGRLAVIYLPTRHTISLNRSVMGRGRAEWVDPATGATMVVPMASTFTSPGTNGAGDSDWLLVLRS